MRRFTAILAAVLLLPSLVLAGPKIWSDAEGGMSPAEIREVFPEVEEGTRDTIGSVEAVELWRIPGYTLLDEPFTVRFFFDQEQLYMVMLTHEAPGITTLDSIEKYLDRYSTFYGSPDVVDSFPGLDRPGIVYRQFRWAGSERNVAIVWVRAGEGEPIMNINFTPRS